MTRPADIKDILAQNLDALMKDRGLSQAELARRSKRYGGISQKTISNILSRQHAASVEHIGTLAAVFGIHPALLISHADLKQVAQPKESQPAHKADRQDLYELISNLPARTRALNKARLALQIAVKDIAEESNQEKKSRKRA